MKKPAFRKPRCFLITAEAPNRLTAAQANRTFNEFVADPGLPLVIFHDHFIGRPGGVAIFFAENRQEIEALYQPGFLEGWDIAIHPLIYSSSPAALDEQIAFTLLHYRGVDWEVLQKEQRPSYGDPQREFESAEEEDPDSVSGRTGWQERLR